MQKGATKKFCDKIRNSKIIFAIDFYDFLMTSKKIVLKLADFVMKSTKVLSGKLRFDSAKKRFCQEIA